MEGGEGIGEGISSTENRPHGPTTRITGKGEERSSRSRRRRRRWRRRGGKRWEREGLAEPRDTPRSRGRLGWDTWREKRAHPYANAAVARTTKQAHAHGGVRGDSSALRSVKETLHASTDGVVLVFDGGRESGLCSGAHQMPLDLRSTPAVGRSIPTVVSKFCRDFAAADTSQLFAARRRDRSGGKQRRARRWIRT